MLCALDMSVHSTHIVYGGVECPCRGLHTLVMGLSAVAQIALHWCAVTDLALCLVLNRVGLGMGRSPIEFHSVKRKWKMKCVGRSK